MVVVMFIPVDARCTRVCMLANVSTDAAGCGVPVSCCSFLGVASGDGIFVVPCVLVDALCGVCVTLAGERPDARFVHLSASKNVWITYLHSLTG